MKNYSDNSGFTLVELLIVIAIIGILAVVVLGSLNTAREEGLSAKIKSELSILIKRAKIDESQSLTYDVVCGSNGFATSTNIRFILDSVERYSPENVVCNSATDEFAVSAAMSSTTFWCVDSLGISREIGAQLGAGVRQCP